MKAFPMAKVAVKPFDFSKLPKLSSRYLEITQALIQRFPQLGEGAALRHSLLEVLEQELGTSGELRFQGMEETTLGEFLRHLASPCLAIVLRAQPSGQKILLEMDYDLACRMVGMILGETERTSSHLRSLSPVEEGVLEYLLVKSLSRLKAEKGPLGTVSLKVARIVNDARMLLESGPPEEAGCLFKFHLGFGPVGGPLLAYVPHPLVEGTFLREDGISGLGLPEEEEALAKRLERVSHIKTTVWSEIGKVTLMASEKSQLEKGDVILFDETLASKGPQGITGKAILRAGETPADGLLAEIIDTEGRMTLKILDFYGGE